MNWGGQKMSAFDMFSSLMSFQAMAGQQAGHLKAPALRPRPSTMPTNSGGVTPRQPFKTRMALMHFLEIAEFM